MFGKVNTIHDLGITVPNIIFILHYIIFFSIFAAGNLKNELLNSN